MKTRNYALDLLKILATSFIVLHHYEQGTQYAAFKFVSFYGGKYKKFNMDWNLRSFLKKSTLG